MKQTTAAVVAALAAGVSAMHCQNFTLPVSISARNGVFNTTNPTNNIDTTNFALRMSRQSHNYTQESLTGYATVSGDYEISASYCEPDAGPSKVLQFLTHGIGFDKSYWNFPYNNYNYSYAYEAVDRAGYSTFAIDRLGIGESTHFTDPINEGQLWLEVAAIRYLTQAIRDGQISGIAKPEKVVHIGHSFGSSATYTLVAATPGISDGIVLTGFSQNATFASQFVLGSNFVIANQASVFSDYVTGYMAPNAIPGVHIDFFAPDAFDPKMLLTGYQTGKPVTPGELMTLAGATARPNVFKGPVLVITGERDTPYCGGDCLATGNPELASIPASSKGFFPNATNFEAFVVPGAGHGLNFEYSHTLTYSKILNYLQKNGLGASGSGSVSPPSKSSAWNSWNAKV